MTKATSKQVSYIISLYNKANNTSNSYLSQCKKLGLTQREQRGTNGMTIAEASGYIDELKNQLR